eukprot:1402075-Prymnesium_polylepis.1
MSEACDRRLAQLGEEKRRALEELNLVLGDKAVEERRAAEKAEAERRARAETIGKKAARRISCLLYTSDAADDM